MAILSVTQGAVAAGLTSFGLMVATRALTLNYIDREDPRGKMAMRIAGSVAPLFVTLLYTPEGEGSYATLFHAGLLFGAVVITASLQKKVSKVIAVSLLVAALVSLLFDNTKGLVTGIAVVCTPELPYPDLASIIPFY